MHCDPTSESHARTDHFFFWRGRDIPEMVCNESGFQYPEVRASPEERRSKINERRPQKEGKPGSILEHYEGGRERYQDP